MQGRAVEATEVLEPHSEREVHRAADLLVEEDVAREAVDLVVEAERNLADAARAVVELEQRAEVILTAGGLRGDDPPLLQAEPRVVDLATSEDGRKPEPDRAVDAAFDRARVDLAVGDVLATVGGTPGAAPDDDGQIGVLADDAQLADRAELVRPRLHLLADAGPVSDGVIVEDVAGAENEGLVVFERHLGILGVGLRRTKRPAPAMLATRDPVTAAKRKLTLRGQLALPAVGVRSRERARVRLRPDRHRRVDRVHLPERDRRHEADLLLRAMRHEQLGQPAQVQSSVGVRPAFDRLAVQRHDQRLRHRIGLDPEHLPGLQTKRVVEDELREPVVARIAHCGRYLRLLTRNGRLTAANVR